MVPKLIVTDPDMPLDSVGATIYEDHIRCHPDHLEVVHIGLKQMHGLKFKIMTKEEYLNGTSKKAD